MRNCFRLVSAGLVGMFFVSTSAEARSFKEIEKSKELRICLVVYPGIVEMEPAGCTTDCKMTGPAYDISTAFAKAHNLTPKYSVMEWDEQFHNKEGKTDRDGSYTPQAMVDGKCDVYPNNVVKLPWREKKLDFVVLFPSRMMIVINKSAKAKVKTEDDLGGMTLAVPKDTSFHTWAEGINKGKLAKNPMKIVFANPGEDVELVDSGKADLMIHDSDGALYTVKHKGKNITVAFPVGEKDDIGWAMNKADKDLHAKVQEFFDKERSDKNSQLNTIWTKYFGMSLTNFISLVTRVK